MWFLWRLLKKNQEQAFLTLLIQYCSVTKVAFLLVITIPSIDMLGKSAVQIFLAHINVVLHKRPAK